MNGHDIGWAVKQLKVGKRVTRPGWNGKGMYLVYRKGFSTPGRVVFDGYIQIHTAQGTEQPGWLASQSDLLATDWMLAEGEVEAEEETSDGPYHPGLTVPQVQKIVRDFIVENEAGMRDVIRKYIEDCEFETYYGPNAAVNVTVIHPEIEP